MWVYMSHFCFLNVRSVTYNFLVQEHVFNRPFPSLPPSFPYLVPLHVTPSTAAYSLDLFLNSSPYFTSSLGYFFIYPLSVHLALDIF